MVHAFANGNNDNRGKGSLGIINGQGTGKYKGVYYVERGEGGKQRKTTAILHIGLITYKEKCGLLSDGYKEDKESWNLCEYPNKFKTCVDGFRGYVIPTGRYVVLTGRVIVAIGRTGRDHDERVIILPPTTAEEHIAVQRESKARTTLLQSIPDDHVADFHYTDEFRIGEAEGLHKGYDMMQKILSQLNQLKAKPDAEDINLKFLRALPSSWSQVALTLKTKGGLKLLSFDDLYYKLKTLEVDVKGYLTFSSSQSAGPCHSAFVSATSTSKKMSFGDSLNYSLNATYSVPSNSKNGSHRSGNVIEDVLKSFVTNTKPEQKLAYKDLEQIEKLDLEEMDLKWQMAMLSIRVHKFKQKARRKIDFDKKESARFNKKKEEDSKALITVDTLVNWTNHDSESDGVIAAKEFGMIAGCDSKDAIKEGDAKLYNLITGANLEEANTTGDAGEFALMGVTSEWINSSKNLFRLIDSSISARTKVGLGFTNCICKNELGWDDSAFSVFTTNSKDVEGRPIFHRFSKTDSMKVVPPPLSGDYTSLSDYIDLDESQMSYGTKSSTSSDSKSMSNDFVSCDDSDKSLDVNTNDFASSDSSVKYSEHQPNDSTSCASTSSVSTSVNEAEIESNVGKPIKEPIPTGKPKVSAPVPTGKPKVFTPVPTGKPKVSTLVPTGRPNKPSPFPTDRGFYHQYVVPTGRYVVPTGRVIVATGRMDPSGGTSTADELKKLTVKNRYPLPSIDDLIDQL
nr:ribonuclease H-like domain-containing protein [Tanacetum cinerariifolium]